MNRQPQNNVKHFFTANLTFTNLVLIGGAIWSTFKFVSAVQNHENDIESLKQVTEQLREAKADKAELKAEIESIKERQRNQFTRIGELDERIDKIDQQSSYNKGLEEGRHQK